MRLRGPLLVAGLVLASAAPASAATFTVSSTNDGTTPCTGSVCPSIRAALAAALGNGAATVDTISIPAGSYQLTQAAGGQLNVASNVTITGASAATTTIRGDGKNFRILAVTGAGRQATVSHLTIASGTALPQPVADRIGGDILVDTGATLALDHARITTGQAARGAGLAVRGGTANLTKTLVDTNDAASGDGAGILNLGVAGVAPAILTLTDSTVALNTGGTAAGIASLGNTGNAVTLTRSTVASNAAGSNGGTGLRNGGGSITVSGSILAANTGDSTPDNCGGTVTSGGGNADTGSNCGLVLPSDRQNVANEAQQLVSNALTSGGETPVLTIPPASVAVGLAGSCSGADQRDLPRPQGVGCDAGAYEVDQAPDTRIDSGPTGLTNGSPTFTFSSPEPGTGFECRLDGPGAATGAFVACASPKTYTGLTDGAFTLRVRAKDPAFTDATPAVRSFSVDATPPDAAITGGPSGATTSNGPSFTFSASGAATVECRLDGPGATTGVFGDCASPTSFSGLAPGDYTFFVRATDAVGNPTTTSRAFSVTVPQQATPTPSPTPTPTPSPTPVSGRTVVIAPVSGKTLIKKPGSTTFEPVDFTQGIPLGSIIDTRKSKIRLFAIPKPGAAPESALFYDGIFKVTQIGTITQLQLVEALAACKARKANAAAKKPKTRKLWGDGSGSFRTRGQYSAATVRGTKWLVQDSCGKTLTKVAKGVVSVQDFVKHKTLLVRAPKSYTAKQR